MSNLLETRRLSVWELFAGFFQIGIIGFGGTLSIARRILIDDRKWLTAAGFSELFSLCQFLPGANITNLACVFGARHRGVAGGAAAVLGLVAAPTVIVLTMGGLYASYGQLPVARHIFTGLAAAAAGLLMANAAQIARPVLQRAWSIGVVALVVLLVLVHLPLMYTLAVALPLSLLLAWRAA